MRRIRDVKYDQGTSNERVAVVSRRKCRFVLVAIVGRASRIGFVSTHSCWSRERD